MDSKTYRDRLGHLIDLGHRYIGELQQLSNDIGRDKADTIEWNLAVDASRLALSANDLLFRAMYPRDKSALTEPGWDMAKPAAQERLNDA